MPYIRPEQRAPIDHWLHGASKFILNPGELNYAITKLVHEYLDGAQAPQDSPHYRDFNEVVGVLECAKQELYRDVIGPYEDDAKARNGAVTV